MLPVISEDENTAGERKRIMSGGTKEISKLQELTKVIFCKLSNLINVLTFFLSEPVLAVAPDDIDLQICLVPEKITSILAFRAASLR